MKIIEFIKREYNHAGSCSNIVIFVFALALLIIYGYFWTFIYGLIEPECHKEEGSCYLGGGFIYAAFTN